MKFSVLLLLAIVAFATIKADVQADLVTDLNEQTGYTKPWYSGYLDVSNKENQMRSHYFFFPSQNDPTTDPVLLWLNGGPGCSSLLGASQENGPWVFKTNSTEIELNPLSWNNNASVIYIESPPGVGFSTSEKVPIWDDQSTAQINLEAVAAFFRSYEEYRNLEFFIAGESYAGIYIPTLATQIVDYNKQVSSAEQINLKGILVGNGCTDPLECNLSTSVDPFGWQVFASQGFFDPEQLQAYEKNCGNPRNPDSSTLNSQACKTAANGAVNLVSPGVNIYNVIGTCYNQVIPGTNKPITGQNTWYPRIQAEYLESIKRNPELAEEFAQESLEEILERRMMLEEENGPNGLPPCTDGIGPTMFFNTQSVKEALHVDTDITWSMCSDLVGIFYSRSPQGSYEYYPDLIKQGVRVWIYSGDTDGAVPTAGTLYWTAKLNQQEKYQTLTPWRAWYSEGAEYGYQEGNRQNAGQYWATEGLTVVTFKGCGHMVPQDNRVGSLSMLDHFFRGEDLPAY